VTSNGERLPTGAESAAGSSPESLTFETLRDGGQSERAIATAVADFLDRAESSLDLAQYDFNLRSETAEVVCTALRRAAGRGVRVRFAYNVDHRNPIPVPPPPEPDADLIASLPVESKAIAGVPDLMHHKYVIRDQAHVWSGSTNWTDDSWTRQENVIVRISSRALALAFAQDFDQLWSSGSVEQSGFVQPQWTEVDGVPARAWFTPGYGEELSIQVAAAIGRARERVRICSPVITTGPVLGTLAQVISDGRIDVAGCVDATQVDGVLHQWRQTGQSAWKLPLLERVLAGSFTGKLSTPYGSGSVHDFMHAKVTVADDTVFCGSFNLSRSGESNAENVVELRDRRVAEMLAAYVDAVRAAYPPVRLPPAA
jgi:phosphatidylserine/phosphatidylglycerophosphate/cardiolipin synthase-like enzyme